MPLNPDAVGSTSEPVEVSWDSKDCLLYAVGIGAGSDELAFTTENTNGVEQRVFPTFPVVIGWGRRTAAASIGTFNPALLVHGQQSVTLHRPIPVAGAATMQSEVTAMYDKGKAAVVVTSTTAVLDGQPLYTNTASLFIRGEGGWGGDRGPSGPQNVPPERQPDDRVTYATSPDQALIYRLSGDRNPLHSDPSFAAAGGFERPILHGLCTYGFTGRALLHTLCGSDPARFQHVEGRFTSPVMPGEALTVDVWRTGDGEALFTTSVDGRLVIDQGLVRFELNSLALLRLLLDTDRLAVAGSLAAGPMSVDELVAVARRDRRAVLAAIGDLRAAGLVVAADGDRYQLDQQALRAAAQKAADVDVPMDPAIGFGMTDDERETLSRLFAGRTLTEIPSNRARRQIVLQRLALEFDIGRRYTEREVNDSLFAFHPDRSTLRRYLIDEGFLDRAHVDGADLYWRSGGRVPDAPTG